MKIDGYFTKNDLLVAAVTPVLTPQNRNILVASSVLCFTTVNEMNLKFKEICKRFDEI